LGAKGKPSPKATEAQGWRVQATMHPAKNPSAQHEEPPDPEVTPVS